MRQAIRRLLSPELVFNYLPFQLVSLNPGFPENVQKRGNPNMKKFLSFKTYLSNNLDNEATNSVVIL